MTIASVTPRAEALATRIASYIALTGDAWSHDRVAEMIAEGFAATGSVSGETLIDIVRLLGAEHIRADKAEEELVALRTEHAQELADMAVEVEAAKQRAL